jgi:hypothetical protein
MRQWATISLCLNKRRRILPALAATLVILCICAPALAEDEPFQMENSSWMSFDRYKEKPANWIAPDERTQAAQQPVIVPPPLTPADMPVITSPTRALSAPVLPGVNKDFEVKVDTTEDQHWRPAPVISHMDSAPEMDVQGEWQDAAKTARQKRDKNQMLEGEDGKATYDVRLSYLPARSMPIPKPAKQIAKKTPELPQTKIPDTATAAAAQKPKEPEKPKVDAAACAAIEAYKQHQLQAIESDRQTLKALQNAISQLGLNKQLDFMNGATGSLSIQAGAAGQQQPNTP